jgi:hypothetical protein
MRLKRGTGSRRSSAFCRAFVRQNKMLSVLPGSIIVIKSPLGTGRRLRFAISESGHHRATVFPGARYPRFGGRGAEGPSSSSSAFASWRTGVPDPSLNPIAGFRALALIEPETGEALGGAAARSPMTFSKSARQPMQFGLTNPLAHWPSGVLQKFDCGNSALEDATQPRCGRSGLTGDAARNRRIVARWSHLAWLGTRGTPTTTGRGSPDREATRKSPPTRSRPSSPPVVRGSAPNGKRAGAPSLARALAD